MARDYVCLYHSYLDAIQALGDAERGRLFTAMLEYSLTGTTGHLSGNERFIFPMVKAQIDRDKEKYDAKCSKNRENGKKGANASERQRTPANAPQGKGKGKDKGKGKGKEEGKGEDISPSTTLTGTFELLNAFDLWLDYKAERKESYTPTGLQQLVTRVQNSAAKYGDHAVSELIKDCMAAGWKGIIFDRLKEKQEKEPAKRKESWADLAERLDREEGI